MLLTVLLLLMTYVLIMTLSALLLPVSIIMLVAACSKGQRHRRLFAAGGIALLIPSGFIQYVVHENDIHAWIDRFRYRRACLFDRSVRISAVPVESAGIRLVSIGDSGHGFGIGPLDDATTSALYYLGANGGPRFMFVEAYGKRFSGSWEAPVLEPMGESRARYAISVLHTIKRNTAHFDIRVSRQSDGKQLLRVRGYRYRERMCPSEARLVRLLRDSVVPTGTSKARRPFRPLPPVHRQRAIAEDLIEDV